MSYGDHSGDGPRRRHVEADIGAPRRAVEVTAPLTPPAPPPPDPRELLLRVEYLEREIRELRGFESGSDSEHVGRMGRAGYRIWKCEACGRILANYDPDADELRLKVKTQFVGVTLGVGGRVTYACWGCGKVNQQVYVPEITAG